MLRTKTYTPLFNDPEFLEKMRANGGVDATFHNRLLETELFPKRKVSVVHQHGKAVEVLCKDYPSEKKLYTLSSFLEEGKEVAKKSMPPKKEMLARLQRFPKIPYLLGGTTPFATDLPIFLVGDLFADRNRRLFGIDCTGLLYFVSEGNVPRNSLDYLEAFFVVERLLPLDVVWFPGHVILYLGEGKCIESREVDGVTRSMWEERRKTLPSDYKILRFYGS